jgi:uncharacterized membrane protein
MLLFLPIGRSISSERCCVWKGSHQARSSSFLSIPVQLAVFVSHQTGKQDPSNVFFIMENGSNSRRFCFAWSANLDSGFFQAHRPVIKLVAGYMQIAAAPRIDLHHSAFALHCITWTVYTSLTILAMTKTVHFALAACYSWKHQVYNRPPRPG